MNESRAIVKGPTTQGQLVAEVRGGLPFLLVHHFKRIPICRTATHQRLPPFSGVATMR